MTCEECLKEATDVKGIAYMDDHEIIVDSDLSSYHTFICMPCLKKTNRTVEDWG